MDCFTFHYFLGMTDWEMPLPKWERSNAECSKHMRVSEDLICFFFRTSKRKQIYEHTCKSLKKQSHTHTVYWLHLVSLHLYFYFHRLKKTKLYHFLYAYLEKQYFINKISRLYDRNYLSSRSTHFSYSDKESNIQSHVHMFQ